MTKLMRSLRLRAFLIFSLISIFIVAAWFRGGFIYGGAEVGLFTHNPQRWLEISKYIWWGAAFPGQLIPQFIVGVPVYFSFYVLNLIGLSSQNIQALFFFLMLFLMGFGAFLLSFEIFDETKKKYSIFAGLFYMFNAYTLVQVWHRFLYSTLLLAAVLPFLILFWKKWVREGGITNLSIFLLINFLSVYMYGSLASVVTVWVALTLVTLGETLFPWQGKFYTRKVSARFLGGFVFWVLINIWWIAPTFSIAPGLLPQQHSGEDNLGTLVMLGRQTIMPYLLQLANPFYLFYKQELGTVYSNTLFKVVPWIMSSLILFGLFVSLKLKDYAKFGLIFMIALLLSKGASSPFPYPYIFGFEHSYFLGVIRNPFEKLGIMLPLFGAILFALGFWAFLNWGRKRLGAKGTRFTAFLIVFALIGYAWPMFEGSVFGTRELSVKVRVPDSYLQADKWLTQQKESEGVILHLPFAGKDVVTYDWGEGYHGVDQNSILFTSLPSLSRVVGIKRVDDTLNSLTSVFSSLSDKKQILSILQTFNVKFIVLHKDIRWNDKDTYGEKGTLLEPNAMEKILDNLDYLKKQQQFGQLVIYKLTDENYKPILTLTNNFQIVYPGNTDIMQILSQTKEGGDIVTPISEGNSLLISGKIDDQIFKSGRQVLIFPDKRIDYHESSPSAMISGANSLFTKLLQTRDYFSSLGDLQSEKIATDLISQTEKVFKISSAGDLAEYEESMRQLFEGYSPDLNIHRLFGNLVANTLRLHLAVLDKIGGKTDVAKIIEDNMVKLELIPRYKTYGQVFKFAVPEAGSYELLFEAGQRADIKIDGVATASNSAVVRGEGDHEISYNSETQVPKQDLALRLNGIGKLPVAGRILSFKKESPVSYTGKVSLEKPTLMNFAQAYHPGWSLTLTKGAEKYEVREHFLGNLYGNIWLIDKAGDYNFRIQFTPQEYVEKGIIISVGAAFVIIVLNLFSLRRLIKK